MAALRQIKLTLPIKKKLGPKNEAVEQRVNHTVARQDRHVGRCVNLSKPTCYVMHHQF